MEPSKVGSFSVQFFLFLINILRAVHISDIILAAAQLRQIYAFIDFELNLQCLFPEELVKSIRTPVFVVNSAYDFWQVGFLYKKLILVVL